MKSLERFRGHLFNWYDTGDLRPLDPRYVSSVDSGNLAGHLVALANALGEWRSVAPGYRAQLAGVGDAIDLTREAASRLRDGPRTQTVTWRQLDDALARLSVDARGPVTDEADCRQMLATLAPHAETMADIALALATERGAGTGTDMLYWAQAVSSTIAAHRRDGGPDLDARLAALASSCRSMALEMEFGFLLNRDRMLLSIGYLVPEGRLDDNCYDLLASEARLASFFAIAKGDVPARHWFRLGRSVTPVAQALH